MFADFGEVLSRLRHARNLGAFFDECAQLVQAFTSFDRVMVYRFLPDGAGEVVAERTSAQTSPKFLGLRFPASDIPAQARQLYLTNKLRVLADVAAPMDRLLPPTLPDGTVLDQSHCMLRGPSEVHLAYLQNMDVRATLTMSIVCDARLWGLIACHHNTPKTPPHQIRESLRQVCGLLGEITNMRIEALSGMDAMMHRLTLDHLLNEFHQAMIQGNDLPGVLDAWTPKLLQAFGATNFGVRAGRLSYLGGPGRVQGSALAVLDEMRARLDDDSPDPVVLMWDDLLVSETTALASLPDSAGILLSQRSEQEPIFAFMCRPEHVQEVRWGGKPDKDDVQVLPNGQVRLEPRRSFAEWQQSVRGYSLPWTQVEAEALQNLLRLVSDVQRLHLTRRLQQKLHWRAQHDHLTGLYNRQAMEEEITRLLNEDAFHCALMLLDLDHFKHINDTYGHEVGDQVLQQLALRLKAVTRAFDLLARVGGDEFLLLLQIPHPSPATSLICSERLHQAVAAPFEVREHQLRLGVSVGIAIPPGHGTTLSELLRHAHLALCEAKSRGRSRSAVFELAMASDHLDYFLLERDLEEAVDRNQLALVYQPKVDLLSRKVVGLEALLRWNHPTRGQSSPDAFIPVAERSDQIIRIDRWVMRNAIAEWARWQKAGMAPFPIAINLSIADILSPNLITYLSQLIEEYRVTPAALEIEVTESCLMRELETTQAVLKGLNKHGFATSLDDFGTGFSSLSYLRQLPLQCLKIDKSFTQNILLDKNAEKLTQAIIAMGVALNMTLVAEGVETREQMNWLFDHGCHVGQGYYFSPPVPPDDVRHVIERIELRLAG
ncbi:sensor domain-containing phosphodiesterase [Massilia sp. S19_KUP03_FR1]|uniref:sensor domain-containing phosphodiesterase n=1 Tax=Massilia sp. S19_KUP03_FR1 TaxID=3025503 RepID=UPI002FCD8119